jgi:uncharacterized protein (TIGR04255 family)
MPISFPHKRDVTLKAPPLSEVICQVRFAPILRIGEGLPSQYQELLRKRFPKFARRDAFRVEVKSISALPASLLPANEFVCETADEKSSAVLGVDFIALLTRQYLHWKSFLEDLKIILKTFEKVYGLILATRIGLRYINHLNFSNTQVDSLDNLVGFLNAELTHHYYNQMWSPPEIISNLILLREDSHRLAIRTAIESGPEARVILDYDCYSELSNPTEMKASQILKTVEHYHGMIYNVFRWSIRKEKMQVFKPLNPLK